MSKAEKAAYMRQYYADNRDAIRARRNGNPVVLESTRKARLKYRYGITPEEYDEMLAAQGGVCLVCGGNRMPTRRLAVDHNHETGRIRGLLCVPCNSMIGFAEDGPDLLGKALLYLHDRREV